MADFYLKQGTEIVWTPGGTNALGLTSLANGAGRMGAKVDLGANFTELYSARLTCKLASTPTAGNRIRIALAFSHDNTKFPGGVTGSDAAYTDTDLLRQLVELRSMPVDNSTASQVIIVMTRALGRYVAPVIFDESGQAFSGTGSDHEFALVPLVGVSV